MPSEMQLLQLHVKTLEKRLLFIQTTPMFIMELQKVGPQKDHSIIYVEIYYFWKLCTTSGSTQGGVLQLACRQINLREMQRAPNGKFVSRLYV